MGPKRHRLSRSAWLAVLAAVVVLVQARGRADDFEVTAEVTQTKVTLGSQIEYILRVSSRTRRPSRRQLELTKSPDFQGLRRTSSNPMTSSATNIVNGRMASTLELRWQLTVVREKDCRITAGEAVYAGKTYPLPAIDIQVVKSEADAMPEGFASGDILPAQTRNANLTKQLRGRLFARMEISDKEPYIQESIEVVCKIYIDGLEDEIRNVGWSPPAWGELFAEQVQVRRLPLVPAEISGRQYKSVVVGRFRITPTREGTVEIPLSAAQCDVLVQRNRRGRSFEDRFFDRGFGFQNSERVRMPIAATTIDVRPLPRRGRPPSFQNAVGNFNFSARPDRTRMTQDDLLTLTLTVGGKGFLGSIAEPALPDMPGWTVAGRQSKTVPSGSSKSNDGRKVFEILLRPELSGTLRIPKIAYAFFDPDEERYIEQTAGPFMVKVAKGSARNLLVAEATNLRTAPDKRTPQFFGEQLAHIHTAPPPLRPTAPGPRESALFWPLQGLPALGVLLSLGFRARRGHRERHGEAIRRRRAGSRARRELREAKVALRKKDGPAFHATMTQALRRYLATKLGRSAEGLTLEEIERACLERGVDAEKAKGLRDLIEACDQARYLPEGASPVGLRETYREACELLEILDKSLD